MHKLFQLCKQVVPLPKQPLLFDAYSHRLALAFILYIFIVVALFPAAGRGAGALAVLPVALAATYYGPWSGLLAGALSLPINFVIFSTLRPVESIWMLFEPSAVVGTMAVMGLGYGVGCISNLGKQLQHEVKEREDAQTALEQANQELSNQAKRSAAARNYFLTAVSHELRTPLNAVLGASALLMGTARDVEQQEYIDTVRKGGHDTVQIINTILDYTKVESGALRLNNERFDLLTCLDKIINKYIQDASAKGVELHYNVTPDVPINVSGDVQRLTYILNTLVSNALKFTDNGQVSIYVSATASHSALPTSYVSTHTPYMLEFIVRDSGVGICEKSQEHLFRPFERAAEATNQTYHAIGLSLSLCRSLSQLMGGDIWVKSKRGEGASFHFTVLLDAWSEPAELTSLADLAGKRVLIIGERESIQDNIGSILRRVDIMAIGVDSLESARQVLWSGFTIDLVIIADKIPSGDSTAENECTNHRAMDHVIPPEYSVSYVDAINDLFGDNQPPIVLLVNTQLREHNSMVPADCIDNVLLTPLQWKNTASAIASSLGHDNHRKPDPELIRWRENKGYFDEDLAKRNPLRILMAEDNPVNAKVAIRILERFGYQVQWVPNGLEAVKAIEQSAYDVIFMDIQMPKMGGIEATKTIRHMGQQIAQPHIIALTADTTLEEHAQYKAVGLDDYTGKPISVDVLRTALERAWQQRSRAKIRELNFEMLA